MPSTDEQPTQLRLPPTANGAVTELRLVGAREFFIGRILADGGLAAYEPEVFAMVTALLEGRGGGGHFVDIGANIGLFSLVMRARFGSALAVTAFEPMAAMANWMRAQAAAHALTIDVRQAAVSDADGTANFYVSRRSDTSNSLNPTFRAHKAVLEVRTHRLDSLVAAGMAPPDVLKIDVESFEPSVLTGARETLRTYRPPVICEVLPERTDRQITAFFNNLGYLAYPIEPDLDWTPRSVVTGDSTYRHRDWLFLPATPPAALGARFTYWLAAFTGCGPAPVVGEAT